MNAWLWAATVLMLAPAVLLVVALRRPVTDGIVALEAAGANATLALVAIAEGTGRQGFADVAIVLAFMSFAGTIGFLRFLERAE
jgi:multisubunit Na+/H+ antiporter MnhF subunit